MSVENWLVIIAALGGGAFFKEFAVGIWKWATGRQQQERDVVRSLSRDLDEEAAYRREVTEHAFVLRTILVQLGQTDLIPDFPARDTVGPFPIEIHSLPEIQDKEE